MNKFDTLQFNTTRLPVDAPEGAWLLPSYPDQVRYMVPDSRIIFDAFNQPIDCTAYQGTPSKIGSGTLALLNHDSTFESVIN